MSKILYVSNLGQTMNLSLLEDLFTTVGDVENSRIEVIPETGQSGAFGIVEMSTEQQAADCVERFNGQIMNGHALSVAASKPKPRVRRPPPPAKEAARRRG